MQGTVILRDAAADQWLQFNAPNEIITAQTLADVPPALERVEAWTKQENSYAAGFISYEAAPAFDSALTAHPLHDFPYLWFGLYHAPTVIPSPLLSTPKHFPKPNWTPNVSRATYDAAITRVREH